MTQQQPMLAPISIDDAMELPSFDHWGDVHVFARNACHPGCPPIGLTMSACGLRAVLTEAYRQGEHGAVVLCDRVAISGHTLYVRPIVPEALPTPVIVDAGLCDGRELCLGGNRRGDQISLMVDTNPERLAQWRVKHHAPRTA